MAGFDIALDNVTYTYPGRDEPAIKNLDISIKKNEIVLIGGPNAAGKTTFCRCLNGLVPHFFLGSLVGDVYVKAINTKEATMGKLSRSVGLLFDDPRSQLFCTSVADEVAFGAENLGVPPDEIERRIKESLAWVRLSGFDDRRPQSLSGGQQQAVAIAAIMTMRPDIFVLDEPTSNLDPLGKGLVLSVIRDIAAKENKTLIIVSHEMEELFPLVDRVIVMHQGHVVLDGTPGTCLRR